MNEELPIARALAGDMSALEEITRSLQADIYNLALRFLWNPHDAEDATQEILIKTVLNLAKFEGRSKLSTWVYRIAVNHLIDVKQSRAEQRAITFDTVAAELEVVAPGPDVADTVADALLLEQVKAACSHAMLLCLDRAHRMAFLVGDVLEFSGADGAYVLGIESAAFRKRLSRARTRLRSFMQDRCGLMNAENPCRCHTRPGVREARARMKPYLALTANGPDGGDFYERFHSRTDRLERLAAIYRGPGFRAPERLREKLRGLFTRPERAN